MGRTDSLLRRSRRSTAESWEFGASQSETDLFVARVKSDRFRDKSVPFYKHFNPSVAIGLLVVDNTTNSNG